MSALYRARGKEKAAVAAAETAYKLEKHASPHEARMGLLYASVLSLTRQPEKAKPHYEAVLAKLEDASELPGMGGHAEEQVAAYHNMWFDARLLRKDEGPAKLVLAANLAKQHQAPQPSDHGSTVLKAGEHVFSDVSIDKNSGSCT